MIISRAPLRLSLGGGGTDLPSFYEKEGGFLIAGGINKYIFVGANKQFYKNYNLKYSHLEKEENINSIKHPLFRESLRFLEIPPNIELTSLADIPSGTGLGSSGAFLIALLNTLCHYKGINTTRRTLAEMACEIELQVLKEHEGKQDKYACAYGNIKAYEFHKNGKVSVISLRNEDLIKTTLEENLFMFYTGNQRKGTASDILKVQDEKTKKGDANTIDCLSEIKNIAHKTKQSLENMNFDNFGMLTNEHWEIKKCYNPFATTPKIDKLYKKALSLGATGGKMVGAGGGGFLLFYHPGPIKDQWSFVAEMEKDLKHIKFKFDMEGTKSITKEEKNGI